MIYKKIQLIVILIISHCVLFAQLDARWLGTWKSDDGEKVLTISTSKIVVETKGSKPISYSQIKDMDSRESGERDLGEAGAGISKKVILPSNIKYSQNYKTVVSIFNKNHNKDNDFYARDPKLMLQAINGMPPGFTKGNLWIYDGGDAPPTEYYVNGEKMIEIFDGHYGYSITLFSRTKRPKASESVPHFTESTKFDITEGEWLFEHADGVSQVFNFEKGGTLRYYNRQRPGILYRNGTWVIKGSNIFFELNKRFAQNIGIIFGETMEGKGENKKGQQWSWVASRRR